MSSTSAGRQQENAAIPSSPGSKDAPSPCEQVTPVPESVLPQAAPTTSQTPTEHQQTEEHPRVLGRRYVVVNRAGTGGCSEVLMAQDRQSAGKMVAVKVLREVVHAQEPYPMAPLDVLHALQRGTMPWQREWEAYERLGATSQAPQPHCIPRVYEAGVLNMPIQDEQGRVQPRYRCYLVMELLGHNLYETCAVYGKHRVILTAQDFVVLGQAMLRALQHVHACGLVHRDVKPSNFCLPASSNAGSAAHTYSSVYIMDFDFAALHDPTQDPDRRARFLGTPDYASLRTLRSYQQTPLDDLEALCFSLVEVATGDLPWGEIEEKVPKRGPSQDGQPWTGWTDSELMFMAEFKEEAFLDACKAGQVPCYLQDWMYYLRSLTLVAQPDYDHLAGLLERATANADGPEVWHEGQRYKAAIAECGVDGSDSKRYLSGATQAAPPGKRRKGDGDVAASGPSALAMGEE